MARPRKKTTKGQDRQRARMFLERFRKSCAITVDTPKTSALVFDKVYVPSDVTADAPIEFVTYEQGSRTHTFPAVSPGGPAPEQRSVQMTVRERPGRPMAIVAAPTRESLIYLLNHDANMLCAKIRDTGHRPVLCYSSVTDDNEILGVGDHAFVVACIRNLGIVDEAQLSWEQVLEFRKDMQSRADVGRFLYWLDSAMVGKSKSEIQDQLCSLYENHLGALRKFGIYASTVSETFIAMGEKRLKELLAATFLGGGLFAALASGIVLAGATVVAVRQAKAKIESTTNATAFLHAVAKLAPPDLPQAQSDGPVVFSGEDKWLFR